VDLQASGECGFDSQRHGEDRFAANSFELFAVVGGLVGSAGAPIFRCVDIEESLDHFVVVESGEKEDGGFASANNQFSRAVRHRSI